jgi:hypothetical protein
VHDGVTETVSLSCVECSGGGNECGRGRGS